MYGVFNRGLGKVADLEVFLDGPVVRCFATVPRNLVATLGWGRSPYARRAREIARRRGIPFLCLEDGFLRSVGLGRDDQPLSLVVDDQGVYFDATVPSRLESLIARQLAPAEENRAQQLIGLWRAARVSKYNHLREGDGKWLRRICGDTGSYVLVVDQTAGDASIRYGQGNAQAFARMVTAALEENPESSVLLKVHPEVMAGYKSGQVDLTGVRKNPRVVVLGKDLHPPGVIEGARAVYTVTSQVGFEALLWGKPVRTFGMPFYAGWGLTVDDLAAPARRRAVPLASLVHAALIDYPRYVDPETRQRCTVERLVEWMGLQRRMRERFPATVVALGFSRWKRPILASFFQGSAVRFSDRSDQTPATTCAVWGFRQQPAKDDGDEGRQTIRIEDGFLRSVGLGADLIRPLSWVMDRQGIYYDSSRPSDLEVLLQSGEFGAMLCERARRLRGRLVATGVTKYNVGAGRRWTRPAELLDGVPDASAERGVSAPAETGGPCCPPQGATRGRRVLLVPGQVESDASLAYGSPRYRRNLDLLRAVRDANPGDYVLYKPHPDVVAGLRTAGEGEEQSALWCDEVVTDLAMGELLPEVDEVHTMTSLTGFEALLRGKKVVCYGQPFYCGWGLTVDLVPLARRTRKLSLDELIAGVLLVYPTYVSRATGRFTTAEQALDELLAWRAEKALLRPIWQRAIGRLFRKD
ncbi:capsular polysaccharide biosynthesis protein [Accumulibacter sp.]|uniref:capsular polysaccharide biosynthesis protein n=1 Tax=Accumulibacter sp. TaxID=2053492 RepID=UPI0025E41BC4|nr:capsular polysaccharide biosynthesis protein [Accumulibacter sp.]MCM8612183.1 capsular polysaccharide biosynthesis protein [Accumulibacter sp.]MCM8635856.1 capsular polysaccharide biosynthesis protein [Accumulibacter sp.]MCM8639535.1 capsular polysaccharide biosynthesis protein [Accumulibacter sp.]